VTQENETSGVRVPFLDRSLPAVLILVAVSLVPRVLALGSRPVWYDEAFAALFSAKGSSAVLHGLLASSVEAMIDTHPPLYFLALSGWTAVLGSGPIALRSLSVVFGIGVVLLAYGIGRILLTPRQAFIGAMLTALLPFQVHYAQEARMYSLECLLLLGATACFLLGVKGASPLIWIGFGVLAAAAEYTHHLAFVFLVPLAMTGLLTRRRRVVLGTLAGSALAVALYSPWLLHAFGQLTLIDRAYWIETPGLVNLVRTLLVYIGGLPVANEVLPILLFCVVLVLTYGLLATFRGARRRTQGWLAGSWLLGMSIAPALVMVVVSLRVPIYLERALLAGGVMFALWLGWVFDQPTPAPALRWTALGSLIVAILLGLQGYYTYRGFPYGPFQAIVRDVEDMKREGEVVLHSDKLTALPSVYAGAPTPIDFLADPPGSSTDNLSLAAQQFLGLQSFPGVDEAVGGAPGVWFIVFRQETEEYLEQGIQPHPVMASLGENFTLVGEKAYGDVMVQHYTRGGD